MRLDLLALVISVKGIRLFRFFKELDKYLPKFRNKTNKSELDVVI